jgi:hypothetical protein
MPITRTPWTDDDGTGTTGTIVNNAEKTLLYNQIDTFVDPIYAAWTPYTPTWANTSGAVAIGNGTLAGRYILIGKTVHFVLTMTCGSTTAYGPAGGIFAWGLPPLYVAQLNSVNPFAFQVGIIAFNGALQSPGVTAALTGDSFYVAAASGGLVGPTIPYTWAAPGLFYARGTYDTY